jgi:hypothetical protein
MISSVYELQTWLVSVEPAGVSHLIDGPGSLKASAYPALRSLYRQILIASFIDCGCNHIARGLDNLGW